MNGIVKWFDGKKGYGFVSCEEDGKEYFVHISEVINSGLDTLNQNDAISFETKERYGKISACNIAKK